MFKNGSVWANNTYSYGEGSGTPTEPHHTPSPEAQQTSHTTHSSPSLLLVTSEPLPTVIPSDNPPLRHYTRRARIAQSSVLPPVTDEPASPFGDVSQGEACPTVSSLEAEQDRANIAKTSTLPSDSTPRVTSLAADKGNMQQKLDELTALCTNLQRQQSEMVSKFETQELEINSLKARIKLLEDKDGGVAEQSGDDAPIKGRRLDKGEEATERVSMSSHCQSNFLLLVKKVPPAEEKRCHCQENCTAIEDRDESWSKTHLYHSKTCDSYTIIQGKCPMIAPRL
nr:hypothetical protein [Tanacetum cinerariifolium]